MGTRCTKRFICDALGVQPTDHGKPCSHLLYYLVVKTCCRGSFSTAIVDVEFGRKVLDNTLICGDLGCDKSTKVETLVI